VNILSKKTTAYQPEINIGTLGHVDNGKTTLTLALTGKWTAKHSEELKRGITIRVGYADTAFYKCPKCPPPDCYSISEKCPNCGAKGVFLRAISFVDCPGHHSLMVNMLSGAALIDGALLVIAADAKCPQPQDREHLAAADIVGIKNIAVVQNKVDIVSEKRAVENYHEIKEFVKGTVAEDAPVIPVSAQRSINIDALIEAIEKKIPTPHRDFDKPPIMHILRSFDVNKPGTHVEEIVGGVIGGTIQRGKLKIGDELEIRPGIRKESYGKVQYEPLFTTIATLFVGEKHAEEATCGGLVGVGTYFDPSLTKADGLVGNVAGRADHMPPVLYELRMDTRLFDRAIGTEDQVKVDRIREGEALVINVGTAVTAGATNSVKGDKVEVTLKRPVCANTGDRVTISRRIGDSWRLIGFGIIKG